MRRAGAPARGAAGLALAAAVLALAGCGDDDEQALGSGGEGPSGPADLEVIARDVEFDRDGYSLAAGEQVVAYVQEGEARHTLVIEDADGEDVDGFELEVDGDASDQGTVDLAPGAYTFYCDVPGHREAGMEADLDVTG